MKRNVRMIGRSRLALAACLLLASFASHAAAPAGRYGIDAAAGIVTDNATGLVWQRCASGRSGSGCVSGTPFTLTQPAAASYCSSLSLGGWSSGWRLPTIKELQSIVDVRAFNPAIDTTAFPVTPTDYFWSSSPYVLDTSHTWTVHFGYGLTYDFASSNTFQVRCVR